MTTSTIVSFVYIHWPLSVLRQLFFIIQKKSLIKHKYIVISGAEVIVISINKLSNSFFRPLATNSNKELFLQDFKEIASEFLGNHEKKNCMYN